MTDNPVKDFVLMPDGSWNLNAVAIIIGATHYADPVEGSGGTELYYDPISKEQERAQAAWEVLDKLAKAGLITWSSEDPFSEPSYSVFRNDYDQDPELQAAIG